MPRLLASGMAGTLALMRRAEGGAMRHLVLGASGFLGSHLVEHLARLGEDVRALVRSTDAIPFLHSPDVEVVTGDLLDRESLQRALEGREVVYNCAAVVQAGLPYEAYHPVNVQGIHSLLLACRGKGLRRIVHLSSAEAYGFRLPKRPVDEFFPQNPVYPFQRSKAEGEAVVAAYLGQPDLPISVLRPVPAFGPRDRHLSEAIADFCRTKSGLSLVGGGRATVSLIYARDVARALHLLATDDRAIGQTYLVKGFDTTWREFVAGLCRQLELPASTRSTPYWLARPLAALSEVFAGEDGPALTRFWIDLLGRTRLFDDRRIRLELGFQPEYDLEAALAETAAWLRTLAAEN